MIVLFTSNKEGGVVQFTTQLAKELIKKRREVVCYFPEGTENTDDSLYKISVVYYKKNNRLFSFDESIRSLAAEIEKIKPEFVWFVDEAIICSQVARNLKSVRFIFTIHDPCPHPSLNESLRKKLHDWFSLHERKTSQKKARCIVLLSQNSFESFKKDNKGNYTIVVLPLGAHIPAVKSNPLPEINITEKFFLFFGRIDKYKGLGTILKAYDSCKIPDVKLVVAGKGILSAEEKEMIQKNKSIVLINRYINDGEMLWLFSNALATCLPYIEATQSGVIPISYSFGVPVITSDVKGLTEFVYNGLTGYICKTVEEYSKALNNLFYNPDGIDFRKNCMDYYGDNLAWDKNINIVLEAIE